MTTTITSTLNVVLSLIPHREPRRSLIFWRKMAWNHHTSVFEAQPRNPISCSLTIKRTAWQYLTPNMNPVASNQCNLFSALINRSPAAATRRIALEPSWLETPMGAMLRSLRYTQPSGVGTKYRLARSLCYRFSCSTSTRGFIPRSIIRYRLLSSASFPS